MILGCGVGPRPVNAFNWLTVAREVRSSKLFPRLLRKLTYCRIGVHNTADRLLLLLPRNLGLF